MQMRCHGGKTKIGKQIAEELVEILRTNKKLDTYIEPFCGMCGVLYRLCQLKQTDIPIYATDKNDSIIQMWKSFQDGWDPEPICTKDKFLELKAKKYSSPEKGFYGHAMTFGGLYFQCYQEFLQKSLPSVSRKCNMMAQIMKDVVFFSGDYELSTFATNSLIFCDPPYSKHNRYYDEENNKMEFDSNAFWDWCLFMSKSNVVVVHELYDKKIARKMNARTTLEKVRKCKYSTNYNQDKECLYIIDNRNTSNSP